MVPATEESFSAAAFFFRYFKIPLNLPYNRNNLLQRQTRYICLLQNPCNHSVWNNLSFLFTSCVSSSYVYNLPFVVYHKNASIYCVNSRIFHVDSTIYSFCTKKGSQMYNPASQIHIFNSYSIPIQFRYTPY